LTPEVVAATPLLGVEGYSVVMLNAMGAAPTLGLSFVGDKKRLEDLRGFLHQILRERGSSKIWNALLILRL
jgi:hypothetical protein